MSKTSTGTQWLEMSTQMLSLTALLLCSVGGLGLLLQHGARPYQEFLQASDFIELWQKARLDLSSACLASGFMCLLCLQLLKILSASLDFWRVKDMKFFYVSLSVAGLLAFSLIKPWFNQIL